MKPFTVTITETLRREIVVEADCAADAMIQVSDGYKRGDHVLDYTDFNNVEYKARPTARNRDNAR